MQDPVDEDVNGHTALMYAVRNGSLDMIWLLLDSGARTNLADMEGRTPLPIACVSRHVAAANELLRAGAGVYAQDKKSVHLWGLTQLDWHSPKVEKPRLVPECLRPVGAFPTLFAFFDSTPKGQVALLCRRINQADTYT